MTPRVTLLVPCYNYGRYLAQALDSLLSQTLRDLELTPLHTPQARDGFYFDHTLRRLFSLVATGCGPAEQRPLSAASVRDAFVLA